MNLPINTQPHAIPFISFILDKAPIKGKPAVLHIINTAPWTNLLIVSSNNKGRSIDGDNLSILCHASYIIPVLTL